MKFYYETGDIHGVIPNGPKDYCRFSSLDTEYGFKYGFSKAMELNKDKVFTLEQMVDCWNTALKFQENQVTLGEFIQSLRPKEIEVEIEMVKVVDKTKVVGAVKGVKGSGHKIKTYKSVPKLDEKGCLILKKIEQ